MLQKDVKETIQSDVSKWSQITVHVNCPSRQPILDSPSRPRLPGSVVGYVAAAEQPPGVVTVEEIGAFWHGARVGSHSVTVGHPINVHSDPRFPSSSFTSKGLHVMAFTTTVHEFVHSMTKQCKIRAK